MDSPGGSAPRIEVRTNFNGPTFRNVFVVSCIRNMPQDDVGKYSGLYSSFSRLLAKAPVVSEAQVYWLPHTGN